jgi:hypothetical protein
MSFYIPLPEPPSRGLFEELGIRHVRWVHPLDQDERALPPGYWHLYVHGSSTRGVEVCYEDGRLQVRILIGSSMADFKLALAITHAAARIGGARVEPEDRAPCNADELLDRFNDCWIRRTIDQCGWALRDLVFEQGMIVLICPIREFRLGPRMVQRLDAGPSAGFPNRLLAAICRLQFLDPQRYPEARHFEGHAPNGKEIRVSVWTPGQGFLLPPLPHVCVLERDGRGVVIPAEAVPELPKVRAAWADELRLLVEAVPAERWPVLYAAAICHQVDLTALAAS